MSLVWVFNVDGRGWDRDELEMIKARRYTERCFCDLRIGLNVLCFVVNLHGGALLKLVK